MKPARFLSFVLFLVIPFGFAQFAYSISLSAANATFLGENAADESGHHVAIIGDINNDSFDDFVITAPMWDQDEVSPDNGVVYLFYGKSSGFRGPIDLSSADARFIGITRQEASHDVFGVGDIDGDGYTDFAIGIKKYNAVVDETLLNRLGKIYIFFGKNAKFSGTIPLEDADASMEGTVDRGEAAHVKGVGDVNGDGYDDILVGAGFHSQVGPEAGKVYLFFGKNRSSWGVNEKIEQIADASFLAEAPQDWAGHRVSGVGDVNNDGKNDFIIGAHNYDSEGKVNRGKVYLFLGKSGGWGTNTPLNQADASWIGDNKVGLGWNVAHPGDVDGDGLDDILLGGINHLTYLLVGKNISLNSNQLISTVADVALTPSENLFDDIGHDMHCLGDLNGDRIDDFIIGGSKFNNEASGMEAGKAFIFWGRRVWPSTLQFSDADVVFSAENDGDAAGFSISGDGDINRDGNSDLLISAVYNSENGVDAGKTYLFHQIEQTLTMIYPNGGEVLSAGMNTPISWVPDPSVDRVTLELSVNNGSAWMDIAENIQNSGSYNWTVPNRPSQVCLIRVKDASDGNPSDQSDDVFAITADASIAITSPNGGETFTVGSTVDITWMSGNVNDNVRIELSVDDGTTWDGIAMDTPNTNRYSWTVPDRPTSNALIRIAASPTTSVFDISDAPFTITGSALLKYRVEEDDVDLLGGYGVENRSETSNGKVARIQRGSNGRITYNFNLQPTTYEFFVRYLDESDGNGTSSITINGNTVAEWTWNEAVSSDVYRYRSVGTFTFSTNDKIELAARRNGGEYGRIDYFEFVRPEAPPETITIQSPNGGEDWPIDSSQEITWTAQHTSDAFTIQLSRNGGSSWENLATNVNINPDDSGKYTFNVANVTGPTSDNCRVKVLDHDGTPSDQSDGLFRISESQTPEITITSPNGGETWMTGTVQPITWTSKNTSGTVMIQLSRNAGSNWEAIKKDAPDTGQFDWMVSIPPSDECIIRVRDVTGTASDISDAVFTIKGTPKLTVTAPNGGERWDVGSVQKIRWYSEFVSGTIDITLSRDNGTSWETLVADTTNNGSYDWLISSPETNEALVRVSAVDGSAADTSDAAFTIIIPPSITVTSPNGGEVWRIGESETITWESVKINGDVKIEISRDGGQTWSSITDATPNSGSLAWTVMGPPSNRALIKLSSADGSISDTSDEQFAIERQPQISINSPNGGEEWTIGTQQLISWTSINTSGMVNIELSRDGGASWETVVDSTADAGEYNWTVVEPPSTQCLFKLSDVRGDPFDVSDTVFSIVEPLVPTLIVTAPNGGETWTIGEKGVITWFSQDIISKIKIELSRDNGSTWETLAEAAPDTGAFHWTASSPATDSALVRIGTTDGMLQDQSDAVFVLKEQPLIAITSPNGGESWIIGTIQTILWSSVNTSGSVTIQLSRDNGASWETLIAGLEDVGSYDWTVTGPGPNSCLIMVTGGSGYPVDFSDAAFSIFEQPTIKLTSPNGGETWRLGDQAVVIWESTNGGSSVKIELSRDNGATWEQLIAEAANTGNWSWMVTAPTSENCLIRVTDVQKIVGDESDAVFVIDFPTGIARIDNEVPSEFALLQNFPNPFNPETRIQYKVPVHSDVKVEVYNIHGGKIRTLVDGSHAPGSYMLTWNGKDDGGHQMPSGIYFYRITSDQFTSTKRMTLMK